MHDDHDHEGHDADNPWADRINEAYYDAMGATFGQKTRERINWMCAQARGDTVLDVGCSQGIASILMAREGLCVTGLDIYPPAIEYAKGERAKEIASVQQRLDFRCSELAALGEGEFDTVLMGEVVEHQTNPVRFIRQGAARVAPGGRIIVTVPYGLHPWPDHKSTIFPRHLHEALADAFTFQAIEVTDGYIRVVADRRRGDEGAGDDTDELLRATETGALGVQTSYYSISATAQERAKVNATLEQSAKVMRDAQNKMAERAFELERDIAVRNERSNGLQVALEAARQRVADQAAQVAAQFHAQREEHAADVQRAETLLAQVCSLQSEIAQARADERVEADRVRAAQESLEAATKRVDALRQDLALAHHKRSGHYAHLEAERERSVKLIELVTRYHEDNERYRQSVALALGQALLGLRSPRGIIGFPRALLAAVRSYRRRGGGEFPITPAPLPELRPVHIPPLASAAAPAAAKFAQALGSVESLSVGNQAHALSLIGWKQEIRPGTVPVMSVMDEFSRACFAPHASLVEPRPDNWEGLLDACKPKLLLVESSWKGNYCTWQYRVANYANPPGRELEEMTAGFRARGIPTVFWNKEDPVHFTNFIDSASKFDLVLTTASEAVPHYEERTNARVGVLQFAAEESLHNPTGSAQRNGKVCFAGSFYANRFQERRDDQLMLLDAASAFDFDIFDRNYQPNPAIKSDFAFPDRFASFVRGRLPYDAIGRAYREYRVFLNVNSVIDSPTMFSRRVFELLACGTPVVSTWSRGTEETFGNDLVWHVRDREEAEEAIRVLMTDEREWRRRSLAGIRAVLSAHTYRHRFQHVCQLVGVDAPGVDPFDEVLVVAEVATPAEAASVLDSFRRQQVAAKTSKRLLLACRGDIEVAGADAFVDVARVGDGGLRDVIERSRQPGRQRMLAIMSPFGVYGRHYLQDLLHAARYSGAALVGKASDCLEASQYTYDIALDPRAFLINESLLPGRAIDAVLRGSAAVLRDGVRSYATDSANFVRMESVPEPTRIDAALQQMEL